jgi:hypothetical protein
MTPNTSKKEFEQHLRQQGVPLADLTPAQGIRLVLDFYREVRAAGCEFENDADMLLCQWGTYGQDKERTFQFDITRQFILEEPEDAADEYTMSQLGLIFHYAPAAQFDAVPSDSRWCSTPDELVDFESFILGSAAYQAVAEARATKVVLNFGGV